MTQKLMEIFAFFKAQHGQWWTEHIHEMKKGTKNVHTHTHTHTHRHVILYLALHLLIYKLLFLSSITNKIQAISVSAALYFRVFLNVKSLLLKFKALLLPYGSIRVLHIFGGHCWIFVCFFCCCLSLFIAAKNKQKSPIQNTYCIMVLCTLFYVL